MIQFFKLISFVVNIYMIIIFVRIILTWFSWERNSGFLGVLSSITDPYLNWFRRFSFLRTGYIDFSPIAALGILSLVNRIFSILANYGTITIGVILALLLQLIWGVLSFVIGFLIIILILRLIACYAARNSTGTFWHIVEGMSQPVVFRINRILFKKRIINFKTGIIIAVAILVAMYFVLKTLIFLASRMLAGLPV